MYTYDVHGVACHCALINNELFIIILLIIVEHHVSSGPDAQNNKVYIKYIFSNLLDIGPEF